MRKSYEKLSLSWFLRHPLVATCIMLAMTIALPYLRIGERAKLITLLPLAYAQDEVEETPYEELSEDERIRVDLKHERERVSQLETENARLRESLRQNRQLADGDPSFARAPMPRFVNAQVIFYGDASEWRHSMCINRGRKDGIENGMPVVAGRSLIGRVYLAGQYLAYVQLLTDPGFAASCLIINPDNPQSNPRDRVRGVLRGDGSAMPHFPRLELEDVSVGASVHKGMHVVTSDYSGQFPLGLSVGVVRETIPQAGFLQVRIEANIDLSTLEVVQVLMHQRPPLEKQAIELRKKN